MKHTLFMVEACSEEPVQTAIRRSWSPRDMYRLIAAHSAIVDRALEFITRFAFPVHSSNVDTPRRSVLSGFHLACTANFRFIAGTVFLAQEN